MSKCVHNWIGNICTNCGIAHHIWIERELERLRAAIIEHHSQKADDRCIEDDDRLYAAAGLPPCDRRVGDKAEMLKNCARYIERRCLPGRMANLPRRKCPPSCRVRSVQGRNLQSHDASHAGPRFERVMSDEELHRRFNRIEDAIKEAKSEAADKGHMFIILALLVLLIRSCF